MKNQVVSDEKRLSNIQLVKEDGVLNLTLKYAPQLGC